MGRALALAAQRSKRMIAIAAVKDVAGMANQQHASSLGHGTENSMMGSGLE
jgi:hypothetical protein